MRMSKLEQLLKQQQEIVSAIEAEKTKGRLSNYSHNIFSRCFALGTTLQVAT
jgi:hypothetical protein